MQCNAHQHVCEAYAQCLCICPIAALHTGSTHLYSCSKASRVQVGEWHALPQGSSWESHYCIFFGTTPWMCLLNGPFQCAAAEAWCRIRAGSQDRSSRFQLAMLESNGARRFYLNGMQQHLQQNGSIGQNFMVTYACVLARSGQMHPTPLPCQCWPPCQAYSVASTTSGARNSSKQGKSTGGLTAPKHINLLCSCCFHYKWLKMQH